MRYRQLSLVVLTLSVVALAGCDKKTDANVSAEDCRAMSEKLAQLELELEKKNKAGETPAEPEPEPEPQEQELPNIKVELPPAPDIEAARAPVQWDDDPDGAYSIYGLRKDIDDRLQEGDSGQTIVVKGWVQEIYVPPLCAEDQLCPPAKQPHFWITDGENEHGKKRALMVVGYYFPIPDWDEDTQKFWKDERLVIVEVGKQYTFKGKFRRFSDSGFAHDNGLLEFYAYKARNPDPRSSGEMIWIYPPNSDWHPLAVATMEAQNAELQRRMQREAEALKKKGR